MKIKITTPDGTIIEYDDNQPYPSLPNWPIYPTFLKNSCPKCGMIFDGPMGYVCTDPKCPTGFGSPFSQDYHKITC